MKKEGWILGILLLVVSFIFDSQILNFITSLRTDTVISFMMFITPIGFLFIVLASYSFLLRNPKNLFLLALSVVITYVIGFILKLLIMRERPDLALLQESTYSFPSNHAAIIFSTLPIMSKIFSKYTYLFVVIAFLIAFSRIYLGVHYMSDLIFGGLLGYGVGLIVINWDIVRRKLKI